MCPMPSSSSMSFPYLSVLPCSLPPASSRHSLLRATLEGIPSSPRTLTSLTLQTELLPNNPTGKSRTYLSLHFSHVQNGTKVLPAAGIWEGTRPPQHPWQCDCLYCYYFPVADTLAFPAPGPVARDPSHSVQHTSSSLPGLLSSPSSLPSTHSKRMIWVCWGGSYKRN